MKKRTEELAIDLIDPNPYQPRIDFPANEQKLLSESIRQNGLIQPIVVRPFEDRFQILAGERRFKAVRDLGYPTITAFIQDLDENEMRIKSIVENVQREDLNPIEMAQSCRLLLQDENWTQEKLAQQIGKDRSTISNLIRLLELPEELQSDLRQKKLSTGQARALIPLKDEKIIYSIRDRIIEQKLSVREIEKLIKSKFNRKDRGGNSQPQKRNQKNSEIRKLEENLGFRLGTHVEIWGEQSGSIQIEFKDHNDFNRIFNIIMEKEETDY